MARKPRTIRSCTTRGFKIRTTSVGEKLFRANTNLFRDYDKLQPPVKVKAPWHKVSLHNPHVLTLANGRKVVVKEVEKGEEHKAALNQMIELIQARRRGIPTVRPLAAIEDRRTGKHYFVTEYLPFPAVDTLAQEFFSRNQVDLSNQLTEKFQEFKRRKGILEQDASDVIVRYNPKTGKFSFYVVELSHG